VLGLGGELEEVVCFAAHDDEVLLLGGGEVGREGHGVEETVQAGVVPLCDCVACRRDDAYLYVLAEEVWGADLLRGKRIFVTWEKGRKADLSCERSRGCRAPSSVRHRIRLRLRQR
jgi:hypothetical protein